MTVTEITKIVDDYVNCVNSTCRGCRASEKINGGVSYCRAFTILSESIKEHMIDKIKGVLDEI